MDQRGVALALYDAVNAGDRDAIRAVVSEAYVEHGGPAAQPPGREGLLWFVDFATAAFPDLTATVDHTVVEGDVVAVRLTVTGTHEGAIFGREPTGRSVSFAGMDFLRISGGLIVERWTIRDFRGLVEQLD
jgi:predicted ester cyclase